MDLRFALRALRKNPAFTITAVLTIALGIGTSTAIFSVVNAVLLRPLPYVRPDRLAVIQTDMRSRHVNNFPIPPGDLPDLKGRATAFQSIAAVSVGPSSFVGDDGRPEQITSAGVTPNFFTLLGAHIAFGRNFAASDGTPAPPPATPAARPAPPNPANQLPAMTILSHGFWERRFAGDSAVIGKTVQIAGGPATIIGVTGPDVRLVFPAGISGACVDRIVRSPRDDRAAADCRDWRTHGVWGHQCEHLSLDRRSRLGAERNRNRRGRRCRFGDHRGDGEGEHARVD